MHVSSGYVDQMPRLREFAAMDADDPRRRVVREELILAFLPLVEHVARRHGNSSASVEELTQIGTVGLITAIDRWTPSWGAMVSSVISLPVCGGRSCVGFGIAAGRCECRGR